jgi:hypothetical protein
MTRTRRLSNARLGPTLASALLVAASAAAQDPAASPDAPASPPKIDISGFVDVYYTYNFNRTEPALRSFDVQHNALSLNLAEVAFTEAVSADNKVGFRVDLDFGKTADIVASFEPEKEAGRDIYKLVQQAYGTLLTGKVQWDVGKFVTIHGAEVIETQDNWNYSRSTLFGYAIPFYHVGVRATLPVNDKLTLAGLVVNGWNNSSKIYGSLPCLGLQATLKPTSKVTWIANVMVGQEVPDPASDRTLFDTTLTLAVTPKVSLMLNYDYGKEGDTTWSGLAAYAKLQATDRWALVGRYEYLDDDDEFMTIGQKAQTFTVTSDYQVDGGLKLRLEYRGDFTRSPFFKDDTGGLKRSQSAAIVGLVYAFGGKI